VLKPKKGASKGASGGAVSVPTGAPGDSGSTGNESSRLSVSVLTESSVALDDRNTGVQGVSADWGAGVKRWSSD
jgi:hypothetical protein